MYMVFGDFVSSQKLNRRGTPVGKPNTLGVNLRWITPLSMFETMDDLAKNVIWNLTCRYDHLSGTDSPVDISIAPHKSREGVFSVVAVWRHGHQQRTGTATIVEVHAPVDVSYRCTVEEIEGEEIKRPVPPGCHGFVIPSTWVRRIRITKNGGIEQKVLERDDRGKYSPRRIGVSI